MYLWLLLALRGYPLCIYIYICTHYWVVIMIKYNIYYVMIGLAKMLS